MALDLRRSTVYDFSDLRLHRDGTRIHQTDRNYEASRKRKFSVKDAQGKWRAKDAAGLGSVPKMRCVNLGTDSAREHEEQEEGQLLHAKRGRISHGEKKRGVQPLEHRTVYRWGFDQSLDFLDGTSNRDPSTAVEDKTNLPVPSSELLKNIHYIAAEFYTERGQLLNLGKQYRAEKKRKRKGKKSPAPRKKRRVDEATDAGTNRCQTPDFDSGEYRESSSSDPDSGSDSLDSSSPSETDGDNESSAPAEEVEEIPSNDRSTEERKKRYIRSLREIRQQHQQDMYRVMDGSALMVLGMLVQEHVAKLVRGKVPEGWEGLSQEDEEWDDEEEEQVESESESEEEPDEGEDDDEDEETESTIAVGLTKVDGDNSHRERENLEKEWWMKMAMAKGQLVGTAKERKR